MTFNIRAIESNLMEYKNDAIFPMATFAELYGIRICTVYIGCFNKDQTSNNYRILANTSDSKIFSNDVDNNILVHLWL